MPGRRYNLPHLTFLQGFEAAARTLSFTKAAEELFVTQSAVSRQIKALEENLGLKLFERRSRSLALTDNGQALYRIATDVFDRLQAANRPAPRGNPGAPARHYHDDGFCFALAHSAAAALYGAPSRHRRATRGHHRRVESRA
jgi:DNA-binding transcriptional LysR family regulator